MKLTRICVISLACAGSAVAFGVLANVTIDMVSAARGSMPVQAAALVPPAAAQAGAAATQPTAEAVFALASATSAPADLTPVKVKTVPMVYREAAPAPARATAIPLPRPRPASAPTGTTASLARQPAAMAIASATKADDADPFSPAHLDEMKSALALTAEQEEFWPAVAAELRTIARQLPRKNGRTQVAKVNLDNEAMQRLYWAAAPLLTRLSYDQKVAVKQMARSMGLTEVAEAL